MPSVRTVLSLLDLNPRKFGSMEEFTLVLSEQLRARGVHSVLAFSDPLAPALANKFQESGSTCEVLDFRWGARFYRELIRLIRRYRPEVVHLHFYEQFSLLPLLLRALGVKQVIYTDHCRQPATFGPAKRFALKCWNRVIPPLTGTRFVAISGHIKRVLTDYFFMDGGRIRVILNGVNVERFQPLTTAARVPLRTRFGIPEGHKTVCAAAALIPEKGITYLLQAVKAILEANPNALLLIAGDGRLSDSLKQEAAQLGIADHVRFLGLISDVDRLMAVGDAVVVPSVWQEPAGLVVIEAMSSGRPVVATRVGGIPEYIEDGVTGILVDPRSAEQIACAVNRLLASPEHAEQLGQSARRATETRFSVSRWVSETLETYGINCPSTQTAATSTTQ